MGIQATRESYSSPSACDNIRRMATIADVRFGALDAESEQNLSTYFIDMGILGKLADGRKHLVIGRKGSGKTALFRLADSKQLRQVATLDVEFDKYPWDFHRQLKQSGMLAEAAYEASWRFLFLLSIVREWADYAADPLKKEARKFIEMVVPNPGRGFVASLLARLKNPQKLTAPGIGVGGTFSANLGSVELDKETPAHAIGLMSVHLEALSAFVAGNYAAHPVVIKVDRLDDGWDASEDSKNLIIGELKATRDLNTKLATTSSPAPVLTFLRTDIFEELRFNDKNKLATVIERLEWPDERLVDVLNKRIAASIQCDVKNAWTQVFSTDEMLQRARAMKYITKRTMGRPRDVVAFAIACQEAAGRALHDRVETADIYAAEEEYSQHLLAELIDELHKQSPDVSTYIEVLREVGRMTFDLPEWVAAAKSRGRALTDGEAKAQLKLLFDVSVLGVPKIGGIERGSRYVFAYSERAVKPDFSKNLRVHEGLKKGLDLKDRRARDDSNGLGGDSDLESDEETEF